MSPETLLLFVPACFALNMAFGPNNLLSVTVGARLGLRAAVIAGTGRLAAFSMMIAVAALGMGALLMASEMVFTVVKILGAGYLVWLGLRILRTDAGLVLPGRQSTPDGARARIRREFMVAIGNPKAILIFTAFFPQFVAPSHYWSSFLILGAIFLALETVAIALYAYAGTRLSGVVAKAGGLRWVNRISGATMIGFGAMLALARRPAG